MTDLQKAGPVETITVVDPRNGAIFDPADMDAESLVDILLELRRREQQIKDWKVQVEDELVARLSRGHRATQVVGAYEVDVERGMGREWDAEALEGAVVDLVARDLLSLADIDGLIVRDVKVDGRKAQALLNRAGPEVMAELRRCFTWKQKGRAKVKVAPAAQIEP